MGFIDWHGKKEDRFEEVVQYAKSQQMEEQIRIEDEQKGNWLSDHMGSTKYKNLHVTESIKLIIYKYKELRKMCSLGTSDMDENVSKQLWKDFWVVTVDAILTPFGMSEEQRVTYLNTFINKIFKMEDRELALNHLNNERNIRYKKYLSDCFDLHEDEQHFWRWAIKFNCLTNTKQFIEKYQQLTILIGFYVYQMIRPQNNLWMNRVESVKEELQNIKEKLEKGKIAEPNLRKLKNPIYVNLTASLESLLGRKRVLLLSYHLGKKKDEDIMIEGLFYSIDNGDIELRKLKSIIPAHVENIVKAEQLVEFEYNDRDLQLEADEKVYYMNHTVMFYPAKTKCEPDFKDYIGVLYLTNKRFIFKGANQLQISYPTVRKVIHYDAFPEFLEVVGDDKVCYFQMPDKELAYLTLKLIKQEDKYQEAVKSNSSYDRLLKVADLKSNLSALEILISKKIPTELEELLSKLKGRIEKLLDTTDENSASIQEIENFCGQYMPAIIKLLLEYEQYHNGQTDSLFEQEVYSKIKVAVTSFIDSIHKKIYNVYQDRAINIISDVNEFLVSLEGEVVEAEKLPFSIEELAEKSDINEDIFAFEYVRNYKLPQDLKVKIDNILAKIYGMKKTMELYPTRIDEIHRFLNYYIPEALKIIVSFNRYLGTGLDSATIGKVHQRVMESLETLDFALETKIKEIYHLETMNTVAEADALREILGQDGFVDSSYKFNG